MITINDVAELAGVSKSTVSRVINNNGYVNDDTRKKVEDVIRKYHYSPSSLAKGLSKNETNSIGVVIPEIDNEFFSEILSGINEIIDEHDLTMICCDTNNNGFREERALNMLAQQRVKGLIITPAEEYADLEAANKLRKTLKNLNVPIVVLDRHVENSQWDGVFYDNFHSAYSATEALILEKHKKIGIITGDLSLQIARERFEGYKQALEDYEIELDTKYVYIGNFGIAKAYQISRKIFISGDMPDAILTSNNRTSIGFVKAAKECGVTIGKDIALIGIDHVEILDVLGFEFSCVTRDTKEMGRMAMNVLMERLENPLKERRICIMPYQLLLKGSEK